MPRLLVVTAAMVAAMGAPAHADCDDPFADPNDILSFHITISRADWASLRFDDVVGTGCDAQYPYFEVGFHCGDEADIVIGARRKRGDQRGRDTDEKPPIKLDFNRYVVRPRAATSASASSPSTPDRRTTPAGSSRPCSANTSPGA